MRTVALIVTFNRIDKLKNCWAATAQQSFDEIVVVNNASADGTKEWLDSIVDPRLHRLHLISNVGGAGGFKQGAAFIRDNIKADWVFIYDDDAYPQNHIVEFFTDVTEPMKYDAYATKVVDTSGSVCKMNLPWKKYPATFIENIHYLKEPSAYCVREELAEDIISFSFVGLIIKRDLLSKTSDLIHDELFIYYDDVYYAYHLKLGGTRMRYLPEIHFIHDINKNAKTINPVWKIYYLVRNLLFAKSYFGPESPYSLCFVSMRLIKYVAISIKQSSPLKYIKYVVKGIIDGCAFRTGSRH